jgi:hypothetical protein
MGFGVEATMKALVSLIALCWVPACQFAWAQAPVRACGQIDQIQQTRCQIENAFASRNLHLLNRLFATSVYADVNDTTACGGSGYMTCAFKTRNSEFVSALFRASYSPQPLIKNNYAQLTYAFVSGLQIRAGENDEAFAFEVFKLFLENGASLYDPAYASEPKKTALYNIVSQCAAPHKLFPVYSRKIKYLMQRKRDDANAAIGVLWEMSGRSSKYYDVDNCSYLITWARTEGYADKYGRGD